MSEQDCCTLRGNTKCTREEGSQFGYPDEFHVLKLDRLTHKEVIQACVLALKRLDA